MSIKEIIVDFGTLAGRACRTLVKNTLWQKIESIAKPGQSHSAQPLVPAPDKIIEDVISQSIAAFSAAATSIQEPDATDDVTDHPTDKACSPEPVQVIHTASLSVLEEEIEDENLRELITDRLVGIDEADNLEKQALYAADLLAEINSFIISIPGSNSSSFTRQLALSWKNITVSCWIRTPGIRKPNVLLKSVTTFQPKTPR